MGNLVPLLMEKSSVPQSLLELVVCRSQKGCNARSSCWNVELSCTAARNCDSEFSNNIQEDDYDEDE